MIDVDIVIGANYGDEGKGLATNYICQQKQPSKCCNVLFNGGAQRGHTIFVLTSDGNKQHRIVFQHFGSASISGATTYYGKDFLLNPMVWVQEKNRLKNSGVHINLDSFRDPDCRLQLPIDIYLNRLLETSRNKNRNGSVGLGIWETILRCKMNLVETNFNNWYQSLMKMSRNEQVKTIRNCQELIVKHRLKTLVDDDTLHTDLYSIFINDYDTFKKIPVDKDGSTLEVFMSDGMINHFIDDMTTMYNECECRPIESIIKEFDHLIFEQGQGLMIGMDYPGIDFKYATPSSTGSIEIAKYLKRICNGNIKEITLDYVSRTYLTRHGNGPFPEEDKSICFVDKTNMPNEWQGSIRFGKLDYKSLYERTNNDFNSFKSIIDPNQYYVIMNKNIMMTHTNEIAIPEDELPNIDFTSDNMCGFSPVL